ncbi:MAG TPA: PEP/pyruvate-binding domain-containing protein [Dermatophilaceae bacterium]|nr:PEP/pyruvate-binding domain-containing protein [Dermatophilaceae bacterium]
MPLVIPMQHLGSADLAAVGGKALNLGVLADAGFAVPIGFCITTAAYAAVVADRLEPLLARLEEEGPDTADLAAEARALVAAAPVPAAVRAAVLDAYTGLGSTAAVAVRSSATAEDLATASFAGQQDTYLNVVGPEQLLTAVRRCWASLWTDRAVSYRQQAGIGQRGVALAVVVQEMVDAVAAGVLFTANPVTSSRAQCVLEASPGLGEAVVSGAVVPDRFVVETSSGRITERAVGERRVVVRPRPGGGTEQVGTEQVGTVQVGAERVGPERVGTEPAQRACLSDIQVGQLVRLGARVAAHYGRPQDLEWALAGDGRFWLTQARPITTLYPLVDPSAAAGGGDRVFLNASLAQGLTRPLTPMGLAALRLVSASVAAVAGHPVARPRDGARALHVAAGRVFLDLTPAVRNRLGRRVVLAAFGVMEARSASVLRGLLQEQSFAVDPRPPVHAVAAVGRVALRLGLPRRVLTAALSPRAAYAAIAREQRRLEASLVLPQDATPGQRLDLVEARLGGGLFLMAPRVMANAVAGFLALELARRLLGRTADPVELQGVLRGLPHNVTTEMDLALWWLAERIRADAASSAAVTAEPVVRLAARYRAGSLPPVTQRGLAEFLATYGDRAVGEIDLGLPRWSDDPSHLLGVAKNYLAQDDPELAPPVQFASATRDAEAMVARLVGRLGRSHPVRARLVALLLGRARQLVGLRESHKFLLVRGLGRLHEHLYQVGVALAEAGAVTDPDDVFFLDLDQARRGLAGEPLQDRVAACREEYAVELRRRHIPRLLLSDGTEPEAVAAYRPERAAGSSPAALHGSPASAGTAHGPARVVLDPVGAQLRPGEILVAPSTDPGWTPLFLTAAGLVMEMGGANSHGAVVAREYGIPAVVGVPDATSRISSGQPVTVDGTIGRVTVDGAGGLVTVDGAGGLVTVEG